MCDLKRPINLYGQLTRQELCRVGARSELERCEIGRTRHDVACEVEHLLKFHHLDLVDFFRWELKHDVMVVFPRWLR